MIIGKTFKFEAAHHLPGHEKCGRIHGHTYTLTVEVEGVLVGRMILDFHILSEIVHSLLSHWDHAYLNEAIPGEIPTVENMVQIAWNTLHPLLNSQYYTLRSIQIQEGEGGYARITRS